MSKLTGFILFGIILVVGITILAFGNEEIANPLVETTETKGNIVLETKNYIQAPHHEIAYSISSHHRLEVDDVVWCDRLTGFSMQPSLFEGNTVCFTKYQEQDLSEGMIIKIEQQGQDLIHRVRGVYLDYLITQGDNNKKWERISYKQVKGIAVGVLFT